MMGQLARTDAYYDPFSDSAVTPPEPQIDPRNITAGWAAIAAAHPQPHRGTEARRIHLH